MLSLIDMMGYPIASDSASPGAPPPRHASADLGRFRERVSAAASDGGRHGVRHLAKWAKQFETPFAT